MVQVRTSSGGGREMKCCRSSHLLKPRSLSATGAAYAQVMDSIYGEWHASAIVLLPRLTMLHTSRECAHFEAQFRCKARL